MKLARLREDSVGRFVMLLVHTLSHIKAQDLDNDTDAKFMSEFYEGLATLCDDLFFSRYKGGKPEEVNKGGSVFISKSFSVFSIEYFLVPDKLTSFDRHII